MKLKFKAFCKMLDSELLEKSIMIEQNAIRIFSKYKNWFLYFKTYYVIIKILLK